jgi:hypothetical protein
MIPDKYPRTPHLPWSEGISDDDIVVGAYEEGELRVCYYPTVITEKLDGSNFCMTSKACFARSHSSSPIHPSFSYAKAYHASVARFIPDNLAIYAEYCFARHSIAYDKLSHFVNVFNILDMYAQMWLSWEEISLWAEELGVPTVPVLSIGEIWFEKELMKAGKEWIKAGSRYGSTMEGYVIRCLDAFPQDHFSACCAKFVRANHVQTDKHWKHQEIISNKLKIA